MKMPVFSRKNFQRLLLAVLLGAAVYANSLANSFVYDDWESVAENSFITNGKNLPLLLSRRYFLGSAEISYRPVVTLSYFLDFFVWNSRPFGYHLTSLLVHLLNIVLVYYLVRLLPVKKETALFAALFFALHPINTEAVDVVSYREDPLGASFFLLSLIYWRRATGAASGGGYRFAALAAYFLALFTKEMAITLPLILILLDGSFRTAENEGTGVGASGRLWRYWRRYAEFLLLTLFYLAIRFYVLLNPAEELGVYPYGSFYLGMLTSVKVVASFFRLLAFPVNLCAERGIYPAGSITDLPVAISLTAVLALLALTFFLFRRRQGRIYAFALAWIWITILPVADIVPIGNPGAERYLYLPAVGFCLFLAVVTERLNESCRRSVHCPRRLLPAAVTLLCLFYGTSVFLRNRDWKDEFSICRRTIRQVPESARFHSNLGREYLLREEYEKAEKEFRIAEELQPSFSLPHNNLGITYVRMQRYEEAIAEFQRALALKPDDALTHYNLGNVLFERGEYEKAAAHLRRAGELNSYMEEAFNNLAGIYKIQDNLPAAISAYRKAVAIRPDVFRYHFNLAEALLATGQEPEAIREYEEAVRRQPDFAAARFRLGALYAQNGDFLSALRELKNACELQPDAAEYHYNLGNVYLHLGDPIRAETELKRALELDPEYAEAHNNLGGLYYQSDLSAEAIREYREALKINPELTEAKVNLERILAEENGKVGNDKQGAETGAAGRK